MTPLKSKGYIYKCTNIITGQFYIGQRSSYTGSPEETRARMSAAQRARFKC